MRLKISLPLATLALLSACAQQKSGYIIEKDYDPPSSWTTYDTVCYQYDKNGLCKNSQQVPRTVHEPAHWRFYLREGSEEGWRDVDQIEYNRYQVGQHYPDAR